MTKPDLMKQLIANNFVQLVQDNNVNKVTIQSIIDACGISRNTFYYHFENRAALLIYTFDQGFATHLKKHRQDRFSYLLQLGDYLGLEHSYYYKVTKEADERDILIDHIRGKVLNHLTKIYQSLQIQRELPEILIEMMLDSLSFYAYNQVTRQVLRKGYSTDDYIGDYKVEKYEELFAHLICFIINYYWDDANATV